MWIDREHGRRRPIPDELTPGFFTWPIEIDALSHRYRPSASATDCARIRGLLTRWAPDHTPQKHRCTDLNVNAQNVVIHNDDDTDWDVESWLGDLSPHPEVVHLLCQIIGAVCRPHVRWNKTAWFYSEIGNDGKGTLCELIRQVVGEAS